MCVDKTYFVYCSNKSKIGLIWKTNNCYKLGLKKLLLFFTINMLYNIQKIILILIIQ